MAIRNQRRQPVGTVRSRTENSFDAIVPEQLPGRARTRTPLSGAAELVVAVFPANVKMAIDWSDRPVWMRALAYGRLVLWAVLVYRRAVVRPGP